MYFRSLAYRALDKLFSVPMILSKESKTYERLKPAFKEIRRKRHLPYDPLHHPKFGDNFPFPVKTRLAMATTFTVGMGGIIAIPCAGIYYQQKKSGVW